MFSLRRLLQLLFSSRNDRYFLGLLERIEVLIAKFLSLVMIVITLLSVYDLCLFLVQTLFFELFYEAQGITKNSLFEAFGLLLNVLIALEILANIAVYLKEHAVQYELVVITSLIAVARKIIIFDLEKKQAIDLIALSVAVLALSTSYFLIRYTNNISKRQE